MRDEDIERVLKAAGRRERAPAEIEHAAREQLRTEWRAIVAERRGQRRARAGLAMAASLVVAALGVWFATSGPEHGDSPVATMAVVLNDVRIQKHWWQGSELAATGRVLSVGDSLETRANGRAAIELPGIASARLDLGTRIRLVAADRVLIERGALYVDAGQDAAQDSRLVVETPAGFVQHVGTQYEVRINGDDVRLRVREGRIEWRSHRGGVESGQSGEQLTIAADGSISRTPAISYGETWDWIASTAPAVDIEGRPLAEFLAWAGRELGRDVVFATPEVAAEAASIVVHGSVAGLTPARALEAVLATTSVRGTLDDGRILVSGGN